MEALNIGDNVQARVRVRLVLPCIFLMLLSSLDRVNISFAALLMNKELGFSPADYGFGAGIFFLGYLAGQYPSVLLQRRIGMRAWVSLCALLWGVAATGMAFMTTETEFWILRIVLGLAEGGLAPGIVLYLSQWSTEAERARTFAWPMLAIPTAAIVGAPLSGWLLSTPPPLDVAAWRWMFFIEGLPTILAGIAAYFYFPNTPQAASWLSADERQWLIRNNALAVRGAAPPTSAAVLSDSLTWWSAAVWFLLLAGSYGVIFWLPQVIQHWTGLGGFAVSMLSAVPWVGAAIGMAANSWHSDRTRERFWHVGAPALIAAVCLFLPTVVSSHVVAVMLLFVAGLALGSAQGAFWAMPTSYLHAASLAMGVTTINIAGSSAGLVIPNLIGSLRETSGSFTLPIYFVSSALLLVAVVVAIIRWSVLRRDAPAASILSDTKGSA
jgi:MFS transporter, ACS family, tartrate transporter